MCNPTMIIVLLIVKMDHLTYCKYIQGDLNTNDNWAFLARFCFLSEHGQFEYNIEYSDEQGTPNLLLYYDTSDQWPAVYKTGKNCQEKEAVLHVDRNQIINLTVKNAHFKELSGCHYLSKTPTTTAPPTYTLNVPTLPPRTKSTVATTTAATTDVTTTSSNDTESFTVNELYDSSDFELLATKAPIKKRAFKMAAFPPNRLISCHNARRFRSSRERWWFIAISNCNGNKGIHIKYKLLMTNGPAGDYWHEHFSADEFYILPVLMAFAIAYSFLILGIVMCSIELKSRQLLHTTYKMFVFSVILQLCGILISSVALLKYAVNGIGSPNVKRFGTILMGASETVFLLLLLLLAKGYTITRGKLRLGASVKLTVFMCLYIVTFIAIFIYEANVFDPGEVLYLYESPAGYSLITLRILAWCMFIYSTIFTLKHYPEKANFYYPFNICGTLWFIAGPAFIFSANTYIDKWVRESVVCAILLFITFGGHLSFLILTMPSMANKNFPYHVRTTQIGIMEQNGVEQFNHHNYEPGQMTSPSAPPAIIVPLTRRTEQIFEGMYEMPPHNRRQSNQFNSRDVTMENVRHWSMAKNLPPEIGNRWRNGSLSTNPPISRRNSEHTENNPPLSDTYEKDVPVELFTISKMVVQNPTHN